MNSTTVFLSCPGIDRDDLQPARLEALVDRLDILHFAFAVLAPVGPEADHQRFAGPGRGKVRRHAVGTEGLEGRRDIADVELGGRLVAAAGGQQHEGQDENGEAHQCSSRISGIARSSPKR
jgi:hypothetical protein